MQAESECMKSYLLLFWCFCLPYLATGQDLRGVVTDSYGEALVNASVHWLETTVATTTDAGGAFQITLEGITDKRLIVSYVGYVSDTITITDVLAVAIAESIPITVELEENTVLETVEVTGDRPGTFISSIDPIKTEVITSEELTKSACCDLAGCFNTQASVQPATTNVVTNSKELRILGLSGVYNQILIEGMPLIQGLTYTYGISSIPGTLVDNIFVSKGANSVLQGFEGIAGQINVELREPDKTDQLLVNVYANSFLEKQFNVNYAKRWKKWSSLLAVHTTQPANKFDRDKDDFLDLPLLTRYMVYNKWKYAQQDDQGWYTHFAWRLVNEERIGGQKDFDPDTDQGGTNRYGQTVEFTQPEFYSKTGYRFDDKHNLLLMASGFLQDQTSYFGTARYDAEQQNAYLNLQYEWNWSVDHILRTGVSHRYLLLKEKVAFSPADQLNRTYAGDYRKEEQIPGLFAENAFNWNERKITLLTGIRLDHHQQFGWFATPRALIKYQLGENTTARASIGSGWRTVNLFSENINLLASSRDVIITEDLKPEEAWNYGANLTHSVYGEKVEMQFSFDYYRTQFSNQIFPDYNTDAATAYISNFNGKSISNGFQAEANFEFWQIVGFKLAYNFLDVYRMVNEAKFVLPFNSRHRINSTLSFQPLNKQWHFDMNLHWYGERQQISTRANPVEFQLPETSEPYTELNAQITRSWNAFELYLGCENIFDFRQERPILSWQQPFGKYFDTSTVWGPTRGREFYLGARFTLE